MTEANSNPTLDFLGPEYSWSRAAVELDDVHPLHGGVRVRVRSNAQALVTRVAPGGGEKKFRVRLEWDEKLDLLRRFAAQDFLTIEPADRPGIPDEARPTIRLTNPRHETRALSKWAGVPDERFDNLYQALLELADRSRDSRPIPQRLERRQKALLLIGAGLAGLLLLLGAYGAARAITAWWWPEQWEWLLAAAIAALIGLPVLLLALARRERDLPRARKMMTHPLGMALVGMAVFLALVGMTGVIQAGATLRWATQTTGTVAALEDVLSVFPETGFWRDYRVTFTFQPAGEEAHTRTVNVSQPYFAQLEEGAQVTVYYFPSLVGFAVLDDDLFGGSNMTLTLAALLCAYAFALLLAFLGRSVSRFVDERF